MFVFTPLKKLSFLYQYQNYSVKQFTAGGMEKKTLHRTSANTLAAVIRGIICLMIFWTKSTEEGKLPIIAWQIYLLLESGDI